MKKIILSFFFIFSFIFSNAVHADFMLGLNTGYHSNSDGNTKFTFSDMINHLFIGASIGSKDQLYLGQNISHVTTQYKTSTTTKISTLELGPRLVYYFNAGKNIFATLGWNPYAKGSRTTIAGINQDVSGSAIVAGMGYEIKLSRNAFLGASIMYHSLSVSKAEANNVSTEVSESYSSITPMINLNFRFK